MVALTLLREASRKLLEAGLTVEGRSAPDRGRHVKSPAVVWQHSDKADDVLGRVTDMRETGAGLYVAMKLSIDDHAKARTVFDRLREKSVSQWSFAYRVVASHPSADGATLYLDALDVTEVSAVVAGANPETRTVGVKSFEDERHLKNIVDQRVHEALQIQALASRISQLETEHLAATIRHMQDENRRTRLPSTATSSLAELSAFIERELAQ